MVAKTMAHLIICKCWRARQTSYWQRPINRVGDGGGGGRFDTRSQTDGMSTCLEVSTGWSVNMCLEVSTGWSVNTCLGVSTGWSPEVSWT